VNPLNAPPVEYRTLPSPGMVELRQARGGRVRIVGIAAPFGKLSRNLGGFVETVGLTAFNGSRGRDWPDVIARFNHDPNMLLGTSHREGRPAPTLELSISTAGLAYDCDPPNCRSDVVELIRRGDVRHSSFAFRTIEDRWSTTAEGYPLRTLVSVELVDVAPVIDPAYPDATSALRSLALAADRDMSEIRQLADEDNLLVLWGGERRPRPAHRGPLLGAAARRQLEQLARVKSPWGDG
jgi:uncharacterized protein